MSDAPDLELDAYLINEGRRILCDVRLWLPKLSADDARMEVVAIGVDADEAHPRGLASLKSVERSVDAAPRFEASEILVRQSIYRGPRLAGGTRLTIGHIGRLTVRSAPMEEKVGPQVRDYIQFVLSDIEYGLRQEGSTVKYTGARSVFKNEPRVLRVADGTTTVAFSLERHWTWLKDTKDFISAASTPVLNLRLGSRLRNLSTEQLASMAEDACLFLSLAARHRVLIYGSVIGHGTNVQREWRNPIKRGRAAHVEGAEGVLIDPNEAESYIDAAASAWKSMSEAQKNAIRSAVFSIHPVMERTIEARFVAMFFALEGLAKTWGSSTGTLKAKIDSFHARYVVSHSMLWPLFDSPSLIGLAGIRNHLAHGQNLTGTGSGAVAVANDHLQMWIERMLLRIFGYTPTKTSGDWLQSQLIKQRSEVLTHRAELWRVIKT